MTEREKAEQEIRNFAADQWALIFIDLLRISEREREECAEVMIDYGPPCNRN